MFRELLGRRIIDRKIEKNLVEMSLIPSKYFEALYIERRTEIASPVFDLLEEVGVKRYKIGSGEVTNYLMLEKVAKTGKPIILSSALTDVLACGPN